MVLHSVRIILLSMFYKAYLNVYYFYYSIKVLLLCLFSLSSHSKVEFGIQNPINKLSHMQRTTKILIRKHIHAV